MTNPNPFSEFVGYLPKIIEAYREVELNEIMTEIENFNKRNYKDVAIDVALAAGDREAFYKLVGRD